MKGIELTRRSRYGEIQCEEHEPFSAHLITVPIVFSGEPVKLQLSLHILDIVLDEKTQASNLQSKLKPANTYI